MAGEDTARVQLGRMLRDLYDAQGRRQEDVADVLGWSQPKVSRLLSPASPHLCSPEDVGALAAALGARVGQVTHAQDLMRRALFERESFSKTRTVLARGHPASQQRFEKIEAAAREIRCWHPLVVPGLGQTLDYMRSVARSHPPVPPNEMPAWERRRLARQAQAENKRVTLLLPEGALWWAMPGPRVMADQCRHLQYLAARDGWTVGVIPRGRASPERPEYPMSAFDVYDDHGVMVSTVVGPLPVKDTDDITDQLRLFDRLLALAVTGPDAQRLLGDVAAGYEVAAT